MNAINPLGIKFYEFIGHGPMKKVRGQPFPKGQPQPVWDVKIQRLMHRLPYMREAEPPADMLAAIEQTAKALPKQDEVTIPENWRESHVKRRLMIARKITGKDITKVAEADQVIAAFVGEAPKAEVRPEPVAQAPAEPEPAPAIEAEPEPHPEQTETPDIPNVEIPEDWKSAHHQTKMKWAREISGEDIDNKEAAENIIEIYLRARADG